MKRNIRPVHSKSHENQAYHPGRSGGRDALIRALDPFSGYTGSGEGRNDGYTGLEGPITTEDDTYDMGGGPLDRTRRNRGQEWAPTEYEQLQNRMEYDAVLDAITDAFKGDK